MFFIVSNQYELVKNRFQTIEICFKSFIVDSKFIFETFNCFKMFQNLSKNFRIFNIFVDWMFLCFLTFFHARHASIIIFVFLMIFSFMSFFSFWIFCHDYLFTKTDWSELVDLTSIIKTNFLSVFIQTFLLFHNKYVLFLTMIISLDFVCVIRQLTNRSTFFWQSQSLLLFKLSTIRCSKSLWIEQFYNRNFNISSILILIIRNR